MAVLGGGETGGELVGMRGEGPGKGGSYDSITFPPFYSCPATFVSTSYTFFVIFHSPSWTSCLQEVFEAPLQRGN